MKQIIIGKCAVGKSRICVKNAILNYPGKVILVNSHDATEYLGLDKIGLSTVLLENISEINDFEKIQVDTHYHQGHIGESKELISNFIKKHIDDENTLLIIEETSNIAPECVPLIMSAKNLKADVIMIFQSEEQFKLCYGDKINMEDCIKTLSWY